MCFDLKYFHILQQNSFRINFLDEFMTLCLYLGGFGEGRGDANPGYLGMGRLCQKILWNGPKFSLYRNDFFCVFWYKLSPKVHTK